MGSENKVEDEAKPAPTRADPRRTAPLRTASKLVFSRAKQVVTIANNGGIERR
ncbi:hypothetical protein JCM19038_416 [Geomicrobium sp. JCM 19038]|nr:hypothetical protein [Geomicrobium sp. JCM 19038]GAK06713.1 hypothetical protein JCM19038_416 [Geomicrobium sp. JCM 19038]